ncbi:MAG: glycoside hydrolase family 108 protein [Rhizomicrobium sp.]
MKQDFDNAMKIELVFEGGKCDDPVDPGGRTNQGIIQREFSAYLRAKGQDPRDVYTMLPAERDEIYRKQYADRIKFDELPPGVDLVILDGAINSGVGQSIKWVQRSLGLIADGVMGVVTLEAIQNAPDHDILIASICERRLAFLRALKTFPHFGGGWTKRVDTLKAKGQAWAMGSVGPEVVYIPDGHRKAKISEAKQAPPRAPADALASGGTVTTALSSAQSVFQPMQGTPIADHMILYIGIAAAVLTCLGIVYGLYARRKKAELEDVLDLVAQPPASNDNTPSEELKEAV